MKVARTNIKPTTQTLLKPLKSTAATSKADILISIKPNFMEHIVARTKDHEFRKYLVPCNVKRMWLYVSSPDQTLRYVAVISQGKVPGEIKQEEGMGNADFNAGKKVSKYAYEIKELYQLLVPLPLGNMQSEYGTTFPQRFSYANQKLLDAIDLKAQVKLF